MGLFSRFRSTATEKFKAVTVPIVTPAPPIDPKNARYHDIFFSPKGKAWNHRYGSYTAGELDRLVESEPFTQMVLKKVKDEIIRRGDQWKEKYSGYCPSCGKKFPVLPDPEPTNPESGEEARPDDQVFLCDNCSTELEKPDPKEYELADEVLKHPIRANPLFSFEDLEYLRWNDILVKGNGWIVADLEYNQLNQNTTKADKGDLMDIPTVGKYIVRGLFYIPESYVKRIMDDFGNPGGKYWVCLACRSDPEYIPQTQEGYCKCGKKLFNAHIAVSPNFADTGYATRYYVEGEYHWSPFNPDSILYSMAPIASLGNTIETLIYQTIDMLRMYKDRRTPNQVKWVRVQSREAFDEWLDHQRTHWKQGDETWLAVDSDVSGKPVGVEKTTFSPTEMGSMEYADFLQNTIAIFFGVLPSERGSPESATGLGNQSKELTISTRNTMSYQDRDNEGFYQWLADLFGIKHWEKVHVPPQEEDQVKDAQLVSAWIGASKEALEVGIQPRRRKGSEKFEVFFEGDFDTPEDYHGKQNMFADNPFGDQEEEGDEELVEGDSDYKKDVGGPDGEGSPDIKKTKGKE